MSKYTSVRPAQTIQHGWNLFRNRRTMWQMIREALGGRYRMSVFTTLVFLFAIAYVIFPFDLIPDYIPVIGWIDDGFVVFLLIKQLNRETQRYNRFKAKERRSS